jgi:hypothetical protein
MTKNVYALRRVCAFELRRMAVEAHPSNRSHQAKYLRAVRYLRQRRLWLRDGAKPSWGVPGEGIAA